MLDLRLFSITIFQQNFIFQWIGINSIRCRYKNCNFKMHWSIFITNRKRIKRQPKTKWIEWCKPNKSTLLFRLVDVSVSSFLCSIFDVIKNILHPFYFLLQFRSSSVIHLSISNIKSNDWGKRIIYVHGNSKMDKMFHVDSNITIDAFTQNKIDDV